MEDKNKTIEVEVVSEEIVEKEGIVAKMMANPMKVAKWAAIILGAAAGITVAALAIFGSDHKETIDGEGLITEVSDDPGSPTED